MAAIDVTYAVLALVSAVVLAVLHWEKKHR